jgi:rare lipoprotein A
VQEVRARVLAALAALALVATGCTSASRREPEAPSDRAPLRVLRGKATYYGSYHHGKKTASGERFDMHGFTAAHRTLRFGTMVRVINQRNDRAVIVRINDRGPFGKDRTRVIDVSRAAAKKLNMLKSGVVPVTIEVLEEPPPRPNKQRRKRRPSS